MAAKGVDNHERTDYGLQEYTSVKKVKDVIGKAIALPFYSARNIVKAQSGIALCFF